MTKIKEGTLEFEFEKKTWGHAIKYDETPFYKNVLKHVSCTKAVDIIAASANDIAFIEVKDFRNHSIENRHRFSNGPDSLFLEVALKFRDTIAVLFAAWKKGNANLLHPIAQMAFGNGKCAIEVILFLEQDKKPPSKIHDLSGVPNVEYKLGQKIKALGARAKVYNCSTLPDNIGWTVKSLEISS